MSHAEIRNTLTLYLDDNDELLVAELQGNAAWHSFKGVANSWLADNLGSNVNA